MRLRKNSNGKYCASTAAAIMQTLSASGVGFFATPLTMLVAAMGAAQLAIVAGTSFEGGSAGSVNSQPTGVKQVKEELL